MNDFFPSFNEQDFQESLEAASTDERKYLQELFAKVLGGEFAQRTSTPRISELEGLHRSRIDPNLPTLILLHGITDCHLATDRQWSNRIWLDFVDLIRGRFTRDLTLQSDGRSDQPHIRLRTDGYLRKKYRQAIVTWQQSGFPVEVICYDWRKSVFDSTQLVDSKIRELKTRSERPLVIVGHSMGGVIAATWASQTADWDSLVRRVIFVGSPLAGSYSAADAIMGYSESFRKMARYSLSERLQDFQRMGASFPGLVDLLPNPAIFPEASDLFSQNGWAGGVVPQQAFLDQSLRLKEIVWFSPVYSKAVHLISTGLNTIREMPWNNDRSARRVDLFSSEGDGTVLNTSSQVPELPCIFVPGEHGMLLTETKVQTAVMELAIGADPNTLRSTGPDGLFGARSSRSPLRSPPGVTTPPPTLAANEAPPSLDPSDEMVEILTARYGSDATRGAILGLEANTGGKTFNRLALQQPGFTWQNALSMAIASERAYLRTRGEIRRETEGKWGFHQTRYFDKEHSQGFVTWDDEVVVLAYRGTETNFGDWMRNINVVPRTINGLGSLHSGFHYGFSIIESDVRAALIEANPQRNKQLWITGHSLGGALSIIAGAVFRNDYRIAGVYTYGQPKAVVSGIQDIYRNHLRNVYHRFVNNLDIVPRVPPGYVHFGNLIWFDEHGSVRSAAPTGPLGLRAQVGMEELADAPDSQDDLTESEFQQLLAAIENREEELAAHGMEIDPIEIQQAAIESSLSRTSGPTGMRLIPKFFSIREHSVRDQYIPIIARLL
jgi:pimeloyl-ACP methyl ester carboxylesterase